MTSTKRRSGALLIITALALFLTGCMRMHVNVDIQADDTVAGEIIIAYEDAVVESFGMSPDEAWDEMAADEGMPDGYEFSRYAEDGYTGGRYTFTDIALTEWSAGASAEEIQIARVDDEYVVSGVFDMSAASEDEDLAGMEAYLESMDIRMSFTFPHGISEANGEISGNTVTWVAEPGERLAMEARGPADASAAVGGSFPWLWVGIGVGVLAIAGIAAALLVKRRKQSDTGQTTQYGQQPAYGQAPQQYGQPQQHYGQAQEQYGQPQEQPHLYGQSPSQPQTPPRSEGGQQPPQG